MTDEQVKKIEETTKALGALIKEIEPVKPAEWKALESLTAAHKQLRSIELAELSEKNYE